MEELITGTIGVGSLENDALGESEARVTLEERVTTLEDSTADLAEALNMILSSGVAE